MIEKYITRVLEILLIVLMFLITLIVLWQVITRFILNNPSSFTEELARFLLIWISLLGGAYITGKKINLAIDLLPSALKPPALKFVNTFIHLIIALFAFTVMVYGGLDLVKMTFILGQQSAALQINMGFIYSVMPISGILICFYSINHIFQESKNQN